MKINILLIMIIGMFLISLTSANSLITLKNAQLGEQYTIIQVCSDATYINISISNSNGISSSNIAMTSGGFGLFTYNVTPQILGRWDVAGVSDGCEKTFATYFEVTPDGQEMSGGKIALQLFASASTLIMFILFLYLSGTGIKSGMAKQESGGLRFLFMGLSFVFLVAHILITNVIIHDTLGASSSMASSYTAVMYIFFTIIIVSFLYTLFKLMVWEVDVFLKSKGRR